MTEHIVEELSGDGYPTDLGLRLLATFEGSPRDLVDVLGRTFGRMGGVWTERTTDDSRQGKKIVQINLATGGWSGNESMISALDDSFFWFVYWESSRRGGGYTFYVPESRWDEPMPEWPIALKKWPEPSVSVALPEDRDPYCPKCRVHLWHSTKSGSCPPYAVTHVDGDPPRHVHPISGVEMEIRDDAREQL